MAANPKSASQRALVGFLMVGATKVRAACSTTINVDLTKDTLPISQKITLDISDPANSCVDLSINGHVPSPFHNFFSFHAHSLKIQGNLQLRHKFSDAKIQVLGSADGEFCKYCSSIVRAQYLSPFGSIDFDMKQSYAFVGPYQNATISLNCESASGADCDILGQGSLTAEAVLEFSGGQDPCGAPTDSERSCEDCKSRRGIDGRTCAYCPNAGRFVNGPRAPGKGCWTADRFYKTQNCVNKCDRMNHCEAENLPLQYIWNQRTSSGNNGKTVTQWDAIQETIHDQKFLKIGLQLTAKIRKYRELTGDDPNHADYFRYSAAASNGAWEKSKSSWGDSSYSSSAVKRAIQDYLPDGVTVAERKDTSCGGGIKAASYDAAPGAGCTTDVLYRVNTERFLRGHRPDERYEALFRVGSDEADSTNQPIVGPAPNHVFNQPPLGTKETMTQVVLLTFLGRFPDLTRLLMRPVPRRGNNPVFAAYGAASEDFQFSNFVPAGDPWETAATAVDGALARAFPGRAQPIQFPRVVVDDPGPHPGPVGRISSWITDRLLHLPLPQQPINFVPVVAYVRFSNSTIVARADHRRAQALVRCMATGLARNPTWKLVAVFAVAFGTNRGIPPWWTCSIEFVYHGLNNACSDGQ